MMPYCTSNRTSYSFSPIWTLADEVALFWGIPYVNQELISTEKDQVGSVSTEMLLKKDMDSFTFSNGWAFPRRIYFSGETCQMPLPDTFPMLPNGVVPNFAKPSLCLFLLLTFLTSQALLGPWLWWIRTINHTHKAWFEWMIPNYFLWVFLLTAKLLRSQVHVSIGYLWDWVWTAITVICPSYLGSIECWCFSYKSVVKI